MFLRLEVDPEADARVQTKIELNPLQVLAAKSPKKIKLEPFWAHWIGHGRAAPPPVPLVSAMRAALS